MLDIGCGINKKKGFVGIDLNPQNKPDIVGDATNLKIESNSVETIYSRRCIQHIQEDAKALAEFYRVLKVEGKLELIVSSWTGWIYYKLGLSASSGTYNVFHLYTKDRLINRLSNAGFQNPSILKIRSQRFRFAYDYLVIAAKPLV